MKMHAEIFFLYKFRKSFVYFGQKLRSGVSTSQMTSELKFMFLESGRVIEWDWLVSLIKFKSKCFLPPP